MSSANTTTENTDKNWSATSQAMKETKTTFRHDVDEAIQRSKSTVREKKSEIATQFSQVSKALEETADRLGYENNLIEEPVRRVARGVESISHQIRDKSLDDFARDTRSFARKKPALALGACFVAGLAISHLFKAGYSSIEKREASPGNGKSTSQTPTGLEFRDQSISTPTVEPRK